MTDTSVHIISKLNAEPFKKNFNVLNFESLNNTQLLQLLNDVFTEIDEKQKANIKEETPEQTAVRMFNFLRVLNYQPKQGYSNEQLSQFRQQFVIGDRSVIHPILVWCLDRLPQHKRRAYLAKFLMKVEIPPEFENDPRIIEANNNYKEMRDNFIDIHKQYDAMMITQHTTDELRNDIKEMEDEKEMLTKGVEQLKSKVGNMNGGEDMLPFASQYRTEMERYKEVIDLKNKHNQTLTSLEKKKERLKTQIDQKRRTDTNYDGADLIKKIEEELKMNRYLAQEKYVKEIRGLQRKLSNIKELDTNQNFGNRQLSDLRGKIKSANDEINKMLERNLDGDHQESVKENLAVFRQQAKKLAEEKEKKAEELNGLQWKVMQYMKRGNDQSNFAADYIPTEDEYNRYQNKLKSKKNGYKRRKAEMQEVEAELGVLRRTEEILRKQIEERKIQLSESEQDNLQRDMNIGPPRTTKSVLETEKEKEKSEKSIEINRIEGEIAFKQRELAPLIQKVKPLRVKAQGLKENLDRQLAKFEATEAGFGSNREALQSEVKELRAHCHSDESKYFFMLSELRLMNLKIEKMDEESKISGDKSYLMELEHRVKEQTVRNRDYRDKQEAIKNADLDGSKQLRLWRNCNRLLKMKKSVLFNEPFVDDIVSAYREKNSEIDFSTEKPVEME
ncbi:hypothetical protein SNEBB_002403 [Seison nebaliae]|nr:hypothetical protein SNEBB_002403 [Seison nebaliae]